MYNYYININTIEYSTILISVISSDDKGTVLSITTSIYTLVS